MSQRITRFTARWSAVVAGWVLLGGGLNAWGAGGPIAVTNTADSGPGSLRQALLDANASPGSTITFNISVGDAGYSGGVWTITPAL